MADRKFAFGRKLPERTAEAGIKEQRIISEAAVAAGRRKDFALDGAVKRLQHASLARERDHADETGGAAGNVPQTAQQQFVVLGIRSLRAGITRRVNARAAAEGFYLQAGI